MTRLKLYLKSLVNPALLFSLLAALILSGCQNEIPPTYKEKDIPDIVSKICKDEYNLDVTTKRTATTLWIYAPLDKILDKDFGIKEDKLFDEEIADKFRNILTTIGRVLLSSDYAPEFFGLVASDIKLGLDYILIGNVLDIKKSYAGGIPWTEANRRYLIKFQASPEAIGDKYGSHFQAYNITLPDFLAQLMAQRIIIQFQEEGKKNYFKVNKCEGKFSNNTFSLEYSIEELFKPPQIIDIKKEMLNIITYCIKTYEFKDFSMFELVDLEKQDTIILSKAAIWSRATD